MRGAAILVLLALAAQPAAAADSAIGRIFYTPEQRAQLDSLRAQKAVATQVREEPVPEVITYQGIVRRSDGKATVWVNNEALSDADLRLKQSLAGRIGRDGQVILQTPQATGSGQVQLKVGQSATLQSGRIEESFSTPKTAIIGKKPEPAPQSPAAGKAAPAPQPADGGRPAAGGAAPR